MAFGRKRENAGPLMVFEYGCLHPTAGEDVLVEQLRLRNNLWNAFVELDRAFSARRREILTLPDSIVPSIQAEIDLIQARIKDARRRGQSNKVDIASDQRRIKELKQARKEARAAEKNARDALYDANKDTLLALEEERRVAVKEAMHASGLHWCNREEVRDHYEAARQRLAKENRQRAAQGKPRAELHFHRFDGSGKVFVRYTQGLPIERAFGANSFLQIDPVPEAAWDSPARSTRRKMSQTNVRLRLASDNRQPVWVELPMVMHRPLPKDGIIRNAAVVRERVEKHFRYKLVVTVELTSVRPSLKKHSAIGIDLGWRMVKEGLRVAYWADKDGNHGQVVLSPDILNAFDKLDDLKSIRDKHFNEIKTLLLAWAANTEMPDWLQDALKTMPQWRSKGRLVGLIKQWSDKRFAGDETIWDALQYWRKREDHLYRWESNLRDRIQRRRREEYRKFAKQLADKYVAIGIEEFDLRKVVEKPSPEDGPRLTTPADKQRTIAAVSTLRLAIENACRRENVECKQVDAKFTTFECHECGYTEKFNSGRQLWRTCPQCHALWDQDYNAARVILKRLLDVLESDSQIE